MGFFSFLVTSGQHATSQFHIAAVSFLLPATFLSFTLHNTTMAGLSAFDTTPTRIYIENLHYGVSRQVLTTTIAEYTGVGEIQLRVIRKHSGKGHQICSAIVLSSSEEEMQHMIAALNSIPPIYLQHILSPGCISLNARQAYMPGARPLVNAPLPIPPPPPQPPHVPAIHLAPATHKSVPTQPPFPPPGSFLPLAPTCAELT